MLSSNAKNSIETEIDNLFREQTAELNAYCNKLESDNKQLSALLTKLQGGKTAPRPVTLSDIGADASQSSSSKNSPAKVEAAAPASNLQLSVGSAVTRRNTYLSQLGTINSCRIDTKRENAPSCSVVHRPNGNVALMTSGLWDPDEVLAPGVSSALLGFELLVEAKASELVNGYDLALLSDNKLKEKTIEFKCTELGLKYRVIGLDKKEVSDTIPWGDLPTVPQTDKEILAKKDQILLLPLLDATAKKGHTSPGLCGSWLCQCLLEIACTAKRNDSKVRNILKARQYATMEVKDIKLPPEFVDPSTGRGCMLLGIEGKDMPKKDPSEGDKVITVVTARLLTLKQWRDSQEFAVGKRPLAARFAKVEGTYHVSSILTKNDPGKTFQLPTSEIKADPSWAIARLKKRVERARELDAIGKVAQIQKDLKQLNEEILHIQSQLKVRVKDRNEKLKVQKNGLGLMARLGFNTTLEPLKKIDIEHKHALETKKSDLKARVKDLNARLKVQKNRLGVGIRADLMARVGLIAPLDLSTPLEPIEQLSNVDGYEQPIPTGVIVNKLVDSTNNTLAKVLHEISIELRKILAPNSHFPEFICSAAQTIYGVLGTQSQLYGWQHVSEYIRNPFLYIERTKSLPAVNSNTVQSSSPNTEEDKSSLSEKPTLELHEAIDLLHETGHTTVKKYEQRIAWLISICERENIKIDAHLLIEVMATDVTWVGEAAAFMKECEERVAELLAKHPKRFEEFRELQKKGVQWPHSPEVREKVENEGLTFRPMMIKRDRCVCDTCGVELSGWRPWYNPRAFHDYSYHADSGLTKYLEPAGKLNGYGLNNREFDFLSIQNEADKEKTWLVTSRLCDIIDVNKILDSNNKLYDLFRSVVLLDGIQRKVFLLMLGYLSNDSLVSRASHFNFSMLDSFKNDASLLAVSNFKFEVAMFVNKNDLPVHEDKQEIAREGWLYQCMSNTSKNIIEYLKKNPTKANSFQSGPHFVEINDNKLPDTYCVAGNKAVKTAYFRLGNFAGGPQFFVNSREEKVSLLAGDLLTSAQWKAHPDTERTPFITINNKK